MLRNRKAYWGYTFIIKEWKLSKNQYEKTEIKI
jgi:hypothetical protein